MRFAGRLSILILLAATSLTATAKLWTVTAPPDRSGSDIQAEYDAALRFQQSGNPDRAAGAYHAFLADAEGELAAEYASAGDYTKAATLFHSALAIRPDSPEIILGYAKLQLMRGETLDAETLIQPFLKQNFSEARQLAQAHQILGRALLKQNHDKEAREELQKAVDLDPSFANRYDLAVVCLDLDDGKCAHELFQGLEQTFGDTPAIHMRFGLAYGNSDFVPETIDEFKRVIAEDPRFPGAHYALAAALLAAGNDAVNMPIAEAELRKELTISPNDYLTYAALGKLAITRQKYPVALRFLDRATSLNPKSPDAFLYLGQLDFNLDRFGEAESALRRAIALTQDLSQPVPNSEGSFSIGSNADAATRNEGGSR